jgi:hypothetical protein
LGPWRGKAFCATLLNPVSEEGQGFFSERERVVVKAAIVSRYLNREGLIGECEPRISKRRTKQKGPSMHGLVPNHVGLLCQTKRRSHPDFNGVVWTQAGQASHTGRQGG